jgi:hypothetical protein
VGLHVDDPRLVVVIRRGCRGRGRFGSLGGRGFSGAPLFPLAPAMALWFTCWIVRGRIGQGFGLGND